jgi:hypothetical protein
MSHFTKNMIWLLEVFHEEAKIPRIWPLCSPALNCTLFSHEGYEVITWPELQHRVQRDVFEVSR